MRAELLFNPLVSVKRGARRVAEAYTQAVSEATELYVLTAYLTDWAITKKLNPGCTDLCFIVGTDFGLTRRAACRAVLTRSIHESMHQIGHRDTEAQRKNTERGCWRGPHRYCSLRFVFRHIAAVQHPRSHL